MELQIVGLKPLREEKMMSQHELAAKAGLTVTTVSRIETGKVKPSLKTIRALAHALDYTPHHFKNLFEGNHSVKDSTGQTSKIKRFFNFILRRK